MRSHTHIHNTHTHARTHTHTHTLTDSRAYTHTNRCTDIYVTQNIGRCSIATYQDTVYYSTRRADIHTFVQGSGCEREIMTKEEGGDL